MAKLKLDLHDIYNKGYKIDTELQRGVGRNIRTLKIKKPATN